MLKTRFCMKQTTQVLFSLLVGILPFAASSQEDQQPAPIQASRPLIHEIRFQNDDGKAMNGDAYMPYVLLEVGEEFYVKKLSDSAERLKKEFPEYVSITTRIDAAPAPAKDSVVIVFEFLRKRFIQYVRVVTPKTITLGKEVLGTLSSKPGRILRGEGIKPDEEKIRLALVNMGYPKAEVSAQVKVLDTQRGTVEVIFNTKMVQNPSTVERIDIVGTRALTPSQVRKVMQTSPAGSGWDGGFFESLNLAEKPIFNSNELENDKARITDLYKDAGFANVAVETNVRYTKTGNALIKVTIKEGSKYSIGKIQLEGNKRFDRKTVLSQLTFQAGSPYSGKSFRKSMQKLREFYGERGHATMLVYFDFDAKTRVLKINLTEGRIHSIDRIEVTGNKSLPERFVRSYFEMKEGDRVNTRAITDAIDSLKKTGYFDEVSVTYVPQKIDSGKIVVAVTEANKAGVDVGFGYGTYTGLQGDLGYNIRKSGMDFSIRAMQSEEESRLSLMFKKPRIFDSKNDLIVGGGYKDQDYGAFDREAIYARVMLEREIFKNLTIGVGTRIEFVNIDDLSAGLPPEVYDIAGNSHWVAGLVGTLVYQQEKVDEYGETHDGYRIRMALLPSFADQEYYMKASATVLAHKTIGENSDGQKHILTGRITLGYASEKTPFYDGLFAGGNGVLRGSTRGGLTPNGSKLPGNALAGGGVYYSMPLFGETFRGVAFSEALTMGSSFGGLGSLRVVSGVGVRANLESTFIRNKIEGGFVFPSIQQPGDEFKPFYLMFGNYHPTYDL